MRIQLNIDQETFENTNTEFTPVPEGEYKVTVFDVKSGEVQSGDNKGKPRLNVQFRIQDGETSVDGKKQGNRRVFSGINAFYGTSKKDGKPTPPFDVIAIAKALGQSAEDLSDLDTDDWLGEELIVRVAHEEKKTKESNYKESFNPPQFREVVKSYRSIDSAAKSATAKATVNAGTGKKSYSL